MRATRVLLIVSLSVAAVAVSACGKPDDSASCTDAELVTRATSAAAILPRWYDEDWGRGSFATTGDANRHEVCAIDAREARRLAEEANARLSLPPTRLVGERETAKFFELSRADNEMLLRVHRCSYLDRSASSEADASEDMLFGTLTVRPITFDVAREAALYAWSLEPQGAVLSEPSTIEAGIYGQDFETATVVRGDNQDEVTVRNVRITVNAFTGEIRRSIGPVTAQDMAACSKTSNP
jgi:hypothetical protein